jgi:bifunctional DNA-binding transcriptional regulator/antitoxin component of YhaV-PrlF toxin-antitoxin module
MATVTVSPTCQVVEPRQVREGLKLRPGRKIAVVEKDGVVHLTPLRPLKVLKGMVPGLSMKGMRDEGEER